ncbi:MAG TPA: hypothetical protein VG052_00715, partial [Puia sp.]|nr:hypothetical protein [Puia sp.]
NGGRPGTAAMNSVGGTRFNPQGRNAPAPMARPAGGMAAGGHPGNAGGNHGGQPGGGHPGNGGGNHGGHPGNGGGGGGEHHH